jgi:hypothetical protein
LEKRLEHLATSNGHAAPPTPDELLEAIKSETVDD